MALKTNPLTIIVVLTREPGIAALSEDAAAVCLSRQSI